MAASPFYAPPLVDAEPLFLHKKAESCVDVTEVAPQGAAGPVTAMSVPRGDVRVVWNVDALTAENGLHPHSRCSGKSQGFTLRDLSGAQRERGANWLLERHTGLQVTRELSGRDVSRLRSASLTGATSPSPDLLWRPRGKHRCPAGPASPPPPGTCRPGALPAGRPRAGVGFVHCRGPTALGYVDGAQARPAAAGNRGEVPQAPTRECRIRRPRRSSGLA